MNKIRFGACLAAAAVAAFSAEAKGDAYPIARPELPDIFAYGLNNTAALMA